MQSIHHREGTIKDLTWPDSPAVVLFRCATKPPQLSRLPSSPTPPLPSGQYKWEEPAPPPPPHHLVRQSASPPPHTSGGKLHPPPPYMLEELPQYKWEEPAPCLNTTGRNLHPSLNTTGRNLQPPQYNWEEPAPFPQYKWEEPAPPSIQLGGSAPRRPPHPHTRGKICTPPPTIQMKGTCNPPPPPPPPRLFFTLASLGGACLRFRNLINVYGALVPPSPRPPSPPPPHPLHPARVDIGHWKVPPRLMCWHPAPADSETCTDTLVFCWTLQGLARHSALHGHNGSSRLWPRWRSSVLTR